MQNTRPDPKGVLGAGDRSLGAPGAFDATALREALCEAEQERHGGCGGDLRSGYGFALSPERGGQVGDALSDERSGATI